jgi:hypothetical protein
MVHGRGGRGLKAEPRTGPGGQPRYSGLAITTALTLRTVFRLALRQTEGLVGFILRLLGLALAVPDHSTLSRRAETLEVPRPRFGGEPVHLLVDSTGLRLCGAGEWLAQTHGTRRCRSGRTLHLATDADTGRIVASVLTTTEAGDAALVGPLLARIAAAIASVTADGAHDGEAVYRAVAERRPDPPAAVVIPPRATTVAGPTAETAPTQRDRHLRTVRDKGRLGWQRAVGHGRRSPGETAVSRHEAIIGRASAPGPCPPRGPRPGSPARCPTG